VDFQWNVGSKEEERAVTMFVYPHIFHHYSKNNNNNFDDE